MKFLSKLGQIVVNVAGILTGFGPLISAMNPQAGAVVTQAEDVLGKISAVIGQVEVFGQAIALPGPQKLTAAAPMVAQELLLFFKARGHKVNNEALFMQGATKVADGMADCWNSLNADALDKQNMT